MKTMQNTKGPRCNKHVSIKWLSLKQKVDFQNISHFTKTLIIFFLNTPPPPKKRERERENYLKPATLKLKEGMNLSWLKSVASPGPRLRKMVFPNPKKLFLEEEKMHLPNIQMQKLKT